MTSPSTKITYDVMMLSNAAFILFSYISRTFTGAKISFVSKTSQKLSQIFAAFDLMSISITLVGYIGDAAVWAVQDKLTGDVQYVVDDRKGS